MPKLKLTADILSAALDGFEAQKNRIDWCDPGSLDISVRLTNEAIPLERPPEA